MRVLQTRVTFHAGPSKASLFLRGNHNHTRCLPHPAHALTLNRTQDQQRSWHAG